MTDPRLVLEVLTHVSSPDGVSRANALLSLKSCALTDPRSILTRMHEIDCLLTTLCCSPTPLWGTIGGLMDVLSTALLNNTENHDTSLAVQLIAFSQIVTETELSHPSGPRPDLHLFSSALIHSFNGDFFIVDLAVVLAIADHSASGYLPDSSLVPILMERFGFVASLIGQRFAHVGADRLARPIGHDGSPFFLVLWVALLDRVREHAAALRALAKRLPTILGLCEPSAQLLVRFLTASPRDRRSLAAEGADVVAAALQETRQRAPSPRSAASAKVAVRRAQVELLQRKKRWAPRAMVLLDDARVVGWPDEEDGVTVELAEIAQVEVTEPGKREAERENVVRIVSKRGEFWAAFATHGEALEWGAMLRQAAGA